eukprot:scaffold102822_cov57-Phaeocystis_antarctica.AAC.2
MPMTLTASKTPEQRSCVSTISGSKARGAFFWFGLTQRTKCKSENPTSVRSSSSCCWNLAATPLKRVSLRRGLPGEPLPPPPCVPLEKRLLIQAELECCSSTSRSCETGSLFFISRSCAE